MEPRPHLVAHDPDPLRRTRLRPQAIDELVELGMLDQQMHRRLAVGDPHEEFPGLRGDDGTGVGQRHPGEGSLAEIGGEHGAVHGPTLDLEAHLVPVRGDGLADIGQIPASRPGGQVHRHVEAVRIARLRQQRLGSGRVVGERLQQCLGDPRVRGVIVHGPDRGPHAA